MSDVRHLYLSQTNKVIAGVCGGLGEYLGIDPVILRVIFVVLFLFSGIGLLGYIVAWLVMPKHRVETKPDSDLSSSPTLTSPPAPNPPPLPHSANDSNSSGRYIAGAILILVGLFFLLDRHFWWWHIERFWPLLLVVAGVLLIVRFQCQNNHRREGLNEPSQI